MFENDKVTNVLNASRECENLPVIFTFMDGSVIEIPYYEYMQRNECPEIEYKHKQLPALIIGNQWYQLIKTGIETGRIKRVSSVFAGLNEVQPHDLVIRSEIGEYLHSIGVDNPYYRNEGKQKTPSKRVRKDRMSIAIDAAIKLIGKKPTLAELWQYFQNDRDTTETIVDYTEEKLTWGDSKGSLHDITKKTLANRLSRVK